jgi:hypothetical protein
MKGHAWIKLVIGLDNNAVKLNSPCMCAKRTLHTLRQKNPSYCPPRQWSAQTNLLTEHTGCRVFGLYVRLWHRRVCPPAHRRWHEGLYNTQPMNEPFDWAHGPPPWPCAWVVCSFMASTDGMKGYTTHIDHDKLRSRTKQ